LGKGGRCLTIELKFQLRLFPKVNIYIYIVNLLARVEFYIRNVDR
jgi:hypothetical protein